jgi:hypothetical protein
MKENSTTRHNVLCLRFLLRYPGGYALFRMEIIVCLQPMNVSSSQPPAHPSYFSPLLLSCPSPSVLLPSCLFPPSFFPRLSFSCDYFCVPLRYPLLSLLLPSLLLCSLLLSTVVPSSFCVPSQVRLSVSTPFLHFAVLSSHNVLIFFLLHPCCSPESTATQQRKKGRRRGKIG